MIADILGEPEVDAAVDAVGFEARGHGAGAGEAPATVLNDMMTVARAGASLGIPGLYVTGDPGAVDDNAKVGQIGVRLGLGWAKSHEFTTGQCPVKRYNRKLMNMILADKAHIAKAVNAVTHRSRRCASGLPGVRPGCGEEVRHRPARHGEELSTVSFRSSTDRKDAVHTRARRDHSQSISGVAACHWGPVRGLTIALRNFSDDVFTSQSRCSSASESADEYIKVEGSKG